MSCMVNLPSCPKHSLLTHAKANDCSTENQAIMQEKMAAETFSTPLRENGLQEMKWLKAWLQQAALASESADSYQQRADGDPLDRNRWADGVTPLCQERLRQHIRTSTALGSSKRFHSPQSNLSPVLTLLPSGWASLQARSRCDGAEPTEASVAGKRPLGSPTLKILYSVAGAALALRNSHGNPPFSKGSSCLTLLESRTTGPKVSFQLRYRLREVLSPHRLLVMG